MCVSEKIQNQAIISRGVGGVQTQAGGGHWVAVLVVEEGEESGGWISTSTSLSMAWSLGLGPGTGAREEGACRRGSAACSFIFTAYFFFLLLQHSGRRLGHQATTKQSM